MRKQNSFIKNLTIKTMVISLVFGSIFMGPNQSKAFVPPEDGTIDLKTVVVVPLPVPFYYQKDTFTNFLPTNMSPGNNSALIYQQFTQGMQAKFTQKITDYFLQMDAIKQSGVQKTMDTVQKATSQSVAIQSASGIQHKFAINFKAAERRAVATYEGYFNLTTTYIMDSNSMVTQLSKALSKSTSIGLSNTSPAGQFNNTGMLTISHIF